MLKVGIMFGMNVCDGVVDHLLKTSGAMSRVDCQDVVKAVEILEKVRERNGFVWLVGNGGSGATASHFANDLQKVCGIRAMALVDLMPILTAYGNDEGWHKMFSRALEGYASPGDVVIVFSCSGYSGNAVEVAKEWDGEMVIFTGADQDSKLIQESSAEAIIIVNDPQIMVQESVHLAVCHAIVDVLKRSSDVGTRMG